MNIYALSPHEVLPALLLVQAVIGGIDTLLNHELIARLPHRIEARDEVGIHAVREVAYSLLFGAIAWFAWHGAWACLIGLLLLAVLLVDAADEFIENKTRVLPQNERMLHFVLILNLGFITLVTLPILAGWYREPAGLLRIDHGLLSWALSAFALAAGIWSLRDLLAWLQLGKRMQSRHGPGHEVQEAPINN